MQLTPREKDKLLVSMAAEVARRRLARGVRLNHPEAVALIADAVVEGARDGIRRRQGIFHRRRPGANPDPMEWGIHLIAIRAQGADREPAFVKHGGGPQPSGGQRVEPVPPFWRQGIAARGPQVPLDRPGPYQRGHPGTRQRRGWTMNSRQDLR